MEFVNEDPNDDGDFVTKDEFDLYKTTVSTAITQLQTEINDLETEMNDANDAINILKDQVEDLQSDLNGVQNFCRIWEFEIGSENLKSGDDDDRKVVNGVVDFTGGFWVPYRIVMQRTGDFTSPFTNLSDIQLSMAVETFVSDWYLISPGDIFWQSIDGGLYFANISNQTDISTVGLNAGSGVFNRFQVVNALTGDPDNKQTLYVKIYYQLHQMQNFG